ncbi:MAG TPA: class I SAM-dependent methyltransferase [Gammaproteobacteria bacterium]|nr:class I SAM-dependent methyltransferase [Gammaproteobacteria bacterium]
MTHDLKPTTRFGARVAHYARTRPGYPKDIITCLQQHHHLQPSHKIADFGSGTGLLSRLFLDHGNTVIGIEPNARMREAGEAYLSKYDEFISMEGRAEDCGLINEEIDFITTGQAFHWFTIEETQCEFQRILKPDGWVVLIWNHRLVDNSDFAVAYEAFLHRNTIDYARISRRYADYAAIEAFFSPCGYVEYSFPNQQTFDFEGLKGRVLSSSYAPLQTDENWQQTLQQLQDLFAQHQQNDRVQFDYRTVMMVGHLD